MYCSAWALGSRCQLSVSLAIFNAYLSAWVDTVPLSSTSTILSEEGQVYPSHCKSTLQNRHMFVSNMKNRHTASANHLSAINRNWISGAFPNPLSNLVDLDLALIIKYHKVINNDYWKIWGVRPKWGEKTTFKNMRKHGKLGKIMEDNEENMTTWQGT